MYRAAATAPTRSEPVRRNAGSISGRPDTRSWRPNQPPRTRAAARPPSAGVDRQPWAVPKVRPRTSATALPVPSADASTGIRPPGSRPPAPRRLGLQATQHTTAQASAGGTLTSSVSRHDTAVSRPPSSTPAARPPAPTAAQTDSARDRDGPAGNVVPIRPSTAGCSRAAPRPCTPRAASSTAPLPAAAPAPLAAPNSRIAATNIGRAPYRSVSRPPRTRNPANSTA
jgi:hypothetical protein